MLQKLVTVLIVISLLPIFLYAQERTVLKPKGMTYLPYGNGQNLEVIPPTKWELSRMQRMHQNKNNTPNYSNSDNPLNLIDTLFIVTDPTLWFSNFGFFGQDRMVMWFEAPADLFLKEIGFAVYSAYVPWANIEVKIVAFQPYITRDSLEYLSSAWVGSYEATGNGYHDVTALLDDPDRTGPWTGIDGHTEVFANDIWSDLGVGKTIAPADYTRDSTQQIYTFVDLIDLGYPDILAGTIFGVVLKNLAPALNASRVGIWGTTVNAGNQFCLWKFYADDNTNQPPLDDWGWWQRDITLGYAAVVEIYGNTPPDINSFTTLYSDVNLGPFTVDANITDANPGDPTNAGVASAMIQWSIDGGTNWNNVPMTDMGSDIWSGDIPTQPGNTMVTYRISATDVTSLTSVSNRVDFYVFEPSGANTLVIFNGFDELTGFPQDDYFGPNVSFDHDGWNYGEATSGLLDNYDNVIEIWNENFGVYNEDIVRSWIEGASNRNYLLAGQEYLGAKNSYADSAYVAGDFEYDILGLTQSYNDITYYENPDGTSFGDSLPTLLLPQAGTLFGTPLLDLFNSITPQPDSLMFNPLFVLNPPGLSENLNWQDAFAVLSDVIVDMKVETRCIGSQPDPRPIPIVEEHPTLAHRTLTAGNKIVFLAYDPISLTTADNDSYPYWYWVGADTANTVFQALKWFDVVTGVNEVGGAPTDFALEQNYPNPFNPATTINFSIPQSSKVTLKIYDILGREVSTLVNETRNAGNYKVNFNASGLASGMYIYTITAGDYTASKKMMLLK